MGFGDIWGSVENSRFIGQAMSGCQISHLQMVNIDLKLMLMQNRLENVKFENVILNGYMSGKNTKKENIFKECDMSGFSYTEELSGFWHWIPILIESNSVIRGLALAFVLCFLMVRTFNCRKIK